ncbi:MAG: hypothetical protein KDA89_22175, partial [Planctomycetaceae bacterium]|nr:hypothetical protein [Planctomycetaceae bacterium]
TARYSSFAGLGGEGGFVYRTTDGGNTWTVAAAAGLGSRENISGIAVSGNNIVLTSSASNGGLFRSTDAGATFAAVTSADFTAGDNFTDLVADRSDSTGQRLYAASEGTAGSGGIYRSNDFGQSWTKITGPSANAVMASLLGSSSVIEMTVHPLSGRVYAATLVSGQPRGVFYTDNATAANPTWVQMDIPVLPLGSATPVAGASNASPIIITSPGHGLSNPTNGGSLFVVVNGVGGNTAANGFHAINVIDADTFELLGTTGNGTYSGGGTWTLVTGPSPTAKDIDETGAQGRTHFSITVDPTDPDIVYIGGDRQDRPSAIGDSTFGGAIFRGDAGVARNPNVVPSPQWSHITHDIVPSLDPNGGTANGTSPHADSREMTFDAAGNLIEVDDGGIFKRTNPQTNAGDWFSLAGSLAVVEFHDIAYDTLSNVIMGGAQDNGTQYQFSEGSQVWDFLFGGDGGDVAVDNVTLAASNQSIRYGSSQNLGGFFRTVWDQNNTFLSFTFPNLTLQPGGSGLPFIPQFKTPVELNAVDPRRIIIQGAAGIFESTDQGDTIREVGGQNFPGFLQDAIAYGGYQNGTPNPDVFYVGVGDQVAVRTSAGGAVTLTDPAPADSDDITDVVMNSDDWSNAFAIDGDQVFQTTNSGTTWSDITGDLFSVSGARQLQTLAYITNPIVDVLAVGTNTGVFVSLVSALGSWIELGGGLPNVQVFDLIYDAADDALVAGTLGRGAWLLGQVADVLPLEPDVLISDPTVVEGVANASFSVTLTAPAVTDITLTLATRNVTAIAGQDYTARTVQVTVPTGSTSPGAPVLVPILNNAVAENPETFELFVQSVDLGSVGDISDVGVATILDDDARLTVTAAAGAISENGGTKTITVTRNTPTTSALTVNLTSSDTTEATVPATVTIPQGATFVTFDATAEDDTIVDGTQRVVITAAATGHISGGTAFDVTDDDVATLTLDIVDDAITEPGPPNIGSTSTTATVSRNTDTTNSLTVNLMSSDTGEATVVATVTIPAGRTTSDPFAIDAVDDAVVDGTQAVQITGS